MKYTGQFRDIHNNLYTINIITNGDSTSTTNVVLGASPFTTDIETSENHIYKPCKYSSANIGIISNDYHFDLYSATAQQNKVELLDSAGKVKWTGYTTPNLYSQGYENEFEEVEIEAIDALSTLQYYKYATLGSSKNIVCFIDIIDSLIRKCNAYKTYYISNNTQLNSSKNEEFINKLYISEQNFFDEDGEAMTMQEVLEEICQYLGLTCIADGDQVYFLDYDAIKNGINTYYKYTVGNTSGTLVTLTDTKEIKAGDYSENGGQISLDNVYNKVTVKDSLYGFDSIIPSMWDGLTLYQYNEIGEETEVGGKHKCFFKYYKSGHYQSFYYIKDTMQPINPLVVNYTATKMYVGATICRAYFQKVKSFDDIINKVSYQDYLLLHTHDTNKTVVRGDYALDHWYDNFGITTIEEDEGIPLFQLEVNTAKPSFFGGKNTYLIIQGDYTYMDRENAMYIMQGYSNKDDKFFASELWIKAKLQVGNKFWNGEGWQTTDCCFKLPFDNNNQTDHCINQTFPTKNTISYDMGIDEEGYAIPMPTDDIITGKPTFTLYTPHRLNNFYRCDAVWLSNFDIKAMIANFDSDTDNTSDTEYSNVINNDFVNEFQDINFKICTFDNKIPNYSAVCYSNGGKYQYLDLVYNKATKQTIRLEEHLIYRLVTQYSTPSAILNLNLNNDIKMYSTITDNFLQNKVFIVDSMVTDYRNNKVEIKLIEKK